MRPACITVIRLQLIRRSPDLPLLSILRCYLSCVLRRGSGLKRMLADHEDSVFCKCMFRLGARLFACIAPWLDAGDVKKKFLYTVIGCFDTVMSYF